MANTMHTVHRVYIGARNTQWHRFAPKDENEIGTILSKYFYGWTISKAIGQWKGVSEETMIITIVQTPQTQTGYRTGLPDAVRELAAYLGQYSIMWESNGTATIDSPAAPAASNPTPLSPIKKTKKTSAVAKRSALASHGNAMAGAYKRPVKRPGS